MKIIPIVALLVMGLALIYSQVELARARARMIEYSKNADDAMNVASQWESTAKRWEKVAGDAQQNAIEAQQNTEDALRAAKTFEEAFNGMAHSNSQNLRSQRTRRYDPHRPQ